jgi:hypothetical protein
VNGVPVPNQSEGQQQKGDQQQTGSFRGINRVPLMLVGGIVLAFSLHHGFIVRRSETGGCRLRVRIGRSRGLVLHYASSVVVYRGNRLMPAFQGNSGRLVRFGVFELDLAAGELRKNGAKLRLQEQPFQVLALLLERAGEVVTREELRQKLWPADTFVDFDHGLNTAVNKLRETLGDSASSPATSRPWRAGDIVSSRRAITVGRTALWGQRRTPRTSSILSWKFRSRAAG